MRPPIPCKKCGTRHRTYNKEARCRWPETWWVQGEGRIALLAWCGSYGGHVDLTISLWDNWEDAKLNGKIIDDTGCGGQCVGNHEFVELDR